MRKLWGAIENVYDSLIEKSEAATKSMSESLSGLASRMNEYKVAAGEDATSVNADSDNNMATLADDTARRKSDAEIHAIERRDPRHWIRRGRPASGEVRKKARRQEQAPGPAQPIRGMANWMLFRQNETVTPSPP